MEWCVNSCDELNGDVATECGACASAAQKCRPGAEGHPGSSSSSPVSDFPVFVPSTSSHDTSLTPSKRSAAALVGAFVADAASAGLHWIYEPLEIRRRLAARSPRHPEFHEPPASPAYGSHSPYAHVYPSGASSPYADEVLPLLRSMARLGGFDAADFANESVAFFASYAGRLNSVMAHFLSAERAGRRWPKSAVADSQAHSLVKVPLLCARYAGSGRLDQMVERAVRVHQDDEMAVGVGVRAARILERVILGDSVAEALRWASREPALSGVAAGAAGGADVVPSVVQERSVGAADGAAMMASIEQVAGAFGRSCTLPGAFLLALHVASWGAAFADAVRANILAAGDSCSRSMFLGALLAAEQGERAIPDDWLRRMAGGRLTEVRELAAAVVASRDAALSGERTKD